MLKENNQKKIIDTLGLRVFCAWAWITRITWTGGRACNFRAGASNNGGQNWEIRMISQNKCTWGAQRVIQSCYISWLSGAFVESDWMMRNSGWSSEFGSLVTLLIAFLKAFAAITIWWPSLHGLHFRKHEKNPNSPIQTAVCPTEGQKKSTSVGSQTPMLLIQFIFFRMFERSVTAPAHFPRSWGRINQINNIGNFLPTEGY